MMLTEPQVPVFISRHYSAVDFAWPLGLDDKILIFIDRVNGWQLDVADQCLNGVKDEKGLVVGPLIQHSGHAALHIVFSYFEMIAKYSAGYTDTGRSKEFFREGFKSVFSSLRVADADQSKVDSLLNDLYENVRCGLYHSGMTGVGIVVVSQEVIDVPVVVTDKSILINPYYLVTALKDHLETYKNDLHNADNALLRKNFERRFDYDSS
jgi:hypothetical protein